MSAYTPQPGTVAARAVNALALHGGELSSPVLLEAIGQPADWQGLSSSLLAAVEAGVIIKRMEGRKAFWSLGEGAPRPRPADRPLVRHPAPVEVSPVAEIAPQAEPEAAAPPAAPAAAVPAPAIPELQPADEVHDCEFAITSAGRLLIEAGDQRIALSKTQADQLIAYLRVQSRAERERA